jgi:diphthine-ammonia ligase
MPIKHGKEMIATLFSGGKDSTLALHKMDAKGKKTELLITMISDNDFSYMFHKPNIMHTKLQAEAMGIRQVFYKTKGVKEEELADLEKTFVENGGYRADNRRGGKHLPEGQDRGHLQAARYRMPLAALEDRAPGGAQRAFECYYEVIITQVAAEGFDESMLGAKIDGDFTDRLIASITRSTG